MAWAPLCLGRIQEPLTATTRVQVGSLGLVGLSFLQLTVHVAQSVTDVWDLLSRAHLEMGCYPFPNIGNCENLCQNSTLKFSRIFELCKK